MSSSVIDRREFDLMTRKQRCDIFAALCELARDESLSIDGTASVVELSYNKTIAAKSIGDTTFLAVDSDRVRDIVSKTYHEQYPIGEPPYVVKTYAIYEKGAFTGLDIDPAEILK